MMLRWTHLLLALVALAATTAAADDAVKVDVVLSGLTNPCGIAIQPGTGAVFVSDTGAGQIVKLAPDAPNKSTPVVTGFPQASETNTKEPTYGIGPLGLTFLNQTMLIAGEGALKQGDEVIRVFELPADGKALNYDDAKQKLGPITDPQSKAKGAGNFFGLTMMAGGLAVTAHGADDQGWVLKADLKNYTTFDDPKPFIQLKAVTKIDALLGIAFNKHGFIVLGPRDETSSAAGKPRHQSLLAFYSVKSGNLLMGLATGLHDITGLAYSPKSDRLYALDFAWDDPAQGGLYRLDAATIEGRAGVKAVKMTTLDKPSAMAFGPDNVLYVTVFGSLPKEQKSAKPPNPGKLLKISGEL